ncbi:CpaD family pilus assembly lipoprotein [Pelagibius sp. Alg239-R121]|uniref:CpaD family pilus assembly lipoprotein n=1 Tax=Pelagibius sp. Alg239-R121 TaxID=2993448 RepID=UPI0024A6127B|nr:CpaD family pilus assembly lipoprotein [Pelagibius sp. Alg239-R121]
MQTKRFITPALVAASLLLSACNNGQAEFTEADASQFVYDSTVGVVENAFLTGNWRQMDSIAGLETQAVMQAYAVKFPVGASTITESERSDLMSFLRSKGIRRDDRIQLDGLRAEDNQYLPETEERIEALRLELANLGLRAYVAQRPITIQRAPDERIAIIVTRTLVAMPDCSSTAPGRGQRPTALRDCANKTNLGLMVANPADLQRGSPGGPRDGTAAVLGIERYRAGEIIPLDEILATKEVEQE